jgi:hypothetical protein
MELLVTGGITGAFCHAMVLVAMKKSFTHNIVKLLPVSAGFGAYIWVFGVIRNEEAKNLRQWTLKEHTLNKI